MILNDDKLTITDLKICRSADRIARIDAQLQALWRNRANVDAEYYEARHKVLTAAMSREADAEADALRVFYERTMKVEGLDPYVTSNECDDTLEEVLALSVQQLGAK